MLKVADSVNNILNEYTDNNGYITVLGPVEDILGFFIKYLSKKKKDSDFKRYIMLSVKDKVWSTDFNYDFINCTIDKERDNDNFNKLNNNLPIVLVNIGDKSMLDGHDPNELLDKLPRVTRCEIQWIIESIKNTSYIWIKKSIKINKKTVWVNILKNE